MSFISDYIAPHLIVALESAFVAHEPEARAALLAEINALMVDVDQWLSHKLSLTAPPKPE